MSEELKENGHAQASAPWGSYGAEVIGQPLRASSQVALSLQHHPYQGQSLPMTKIASHKIALRRIK
jgi:hypothetical protein